MKYNFLNITIIFLSLLITLIVFDKQVNGNGDFISYGIPLLYFFYLCSILSSIIFNNKNKVSQIPEEFVKGEKE